jgi:large subunit ribosomal protein L23
MELIKRPIFTDKTTRLGEKYNQYVFYVDSQMTKAEILLLVEKIFSVRATKVNTSLRLRRRRGYTNRLLFSKRAFVTLTRGENIEFF